MNGNDPKSPLTHLFLPNLIPSLKKNRLPQTLQENLSGAVFHPLDDNLIISHGRGHLSFWHRRKDGFFERTDIIKQPSRTHVTSVQFEPDGDVITADTDGFITIYSVDADGA